MTPRRKKTEPRRPRETRGAGTRPGPRPQHLAAWAFVAVAITGVLLARFVGDQRLASSGRALPDSLATLDPTEAYRRATELVKQHRAFESLPYFRRARAGRAGDWRLHVNYSGALHDATLQSKAMNGLAVPVTRNSLERVAFQREALAEFDEAEKLAPSPRERALVIALRGQRLATWGFALEARAEFVRAAALDPSWRDVLRSLDRRLADPMQPDSLAP
jgi:hypothetical protein